MSRLCGKGSFGSTLAETGGRGLLGNGDPARRRMTEFFNPTPDRVLERRPDGHHRQGPEMTDDDMPRDGENGKEPVVFEREGTAETNSLDVADFFQKSHKNVLNDIRDIIATGGEVCRLHFQPTSREVAMPNGGFRLEPSYNMNRSGFMLLAMGFTGKKALEFKLRYIDRFDAMEAALKALPLFGAEAAIAAKPFGQRSANDWTAACRVLDKYEQMFPGSPAVIRWAAKEILGMEMPPAHILEKTRQGDLFDGEGQP